jgi:hydrogenase 3 maturation protease
MSLAGPLAARLVSGSVVVGLGNPLRGDDAAGLLLARRLHGVPGLRVLEAEEGPEAELGRIRAGAPRAIVLVDAVEIGAPPGAVALLEAGDLRVDEPSTHRPPLGLVMRWLAEETGADVFLVGIQPGPRAFATGPSQAAVAAVEELAALIEWIARSRARESAC